MSDAANSKSGKAWLYAAGGLMLLPLLFVLSIGPVAVFSERVIIPMGFSGRTVTLSLDNFYEPLFQFAMHTGTENALGSYVMTWFDATGTRIEFF